MARPSFFTIGRKLGLLFLSLVAMLAIVCGVVLIHLDAMRLDAEQLLEESREAALSSQLLVDIRSLESQMEFLRSAPEATELAEPGVHARIESIRAALTQLEDPDGDDPSRAEHQAAEERLASTIDTELRAVEAALAGTEPGALNHGLERSRHVAEVLAAETRAEAGRANQDLVRRSVQATWIMSGTVLLVAAALCAALWAVVRTIVRPIRRLQARAEAVGRGELVPSQGRPRRDEIGALAASFDEMAERVRATQEELEQRVARRTRELIRAARYADIGVLAAGVAHEINNPLASIASCAEGLERRLARGGVSAEESREYLRTIASEAWRASDITGRLLALARQDTRQMARLDVPAFCEQVSLMTRHLLDDRGLRLAIEVPDPPPAFQADAGALLQIVVNLILNARDASPSGATIRLAFRSRDDAVEILVDDEGPGVPEELVERVFDPFFTTKEPGKGTGLGLALVAALTESHGGAVTVRRSPAGGARFVVRLPARLEVAS